jgi:hypothetical protein
MQLKVSYTSSSLRPHYLAVMQQTKLERGAEGFAGTSQALNAA